MGDERILVKKLLGGKAFNLINKNSELNNKFITMDIETISINSKLTPYLICGYNGTNYITSYANEKLDQKELFNSFINQLLTFFSKNRKLTIYAHNLSSFDGIFLMKYLFQFGKVEPVLLNGKLMSIKVKLSIEGYVGKTIIFKDSYLLLPFSLRKLCQQFDTIISKGHLPFKLTNIFYTGILPAIENYIGLDLNT
jgi:hypothetical protein